MLYNGNVVRNPAVVHDGSQTQIVLYVAKLLFEMSINPSTLKVFDRRNRPQNHVRGKLDVRRPSGAKVQVECWFMYVELSTDAGETDQIEKAAWNEKQKEAAKQRWHEVEDEDLTDAPLDVKIGAAVDLKLRPMQQMLGNLCQANGIEPVPVSPAQPLHSSPSRIRPPRPPIRTDDGAAAAVLNGAADLFERRRAAAPFGELVGPDDSAVAGSSQLASEDPLSA
jgi:hypothetical protein